MHKRRKRELSAANQRGLYYALDALEGDGGEWPERAFSEIEQIEDWERRFPTGEGSVVERFKRLVDGRYQWVDFPCTYQWVRVSNERGKVLGTFYLRHNDGEISELWLAPARKGVAPNPRDQSILSLVKWRKRDAAEWQEYRAERERRAGMTPEERGRHMSVELEQNRAEMDRRRKRAENEPRYAPQLSYDLDLLIREQREIRKEWDGTIKRDTRPSLSAPLSSYEGAGRTGLSEAHQVKGQRPTIGVYPEKVHGGDIRFRFADGKNSFSVAGSKLGPVLMGFRQAGHQNVSLGLVQRAVDHIAQAGKVVP